MLEIDGCVGGGQLLRSSLVLATLTDTPVRVTSIRGGSEVSGLKPQHAAAVRAAARITDARTTGVETGSHTVEFAPRDVSGGRYRVEVGTAGSLTLLFETLLPLALVTERPITVRATGGTDVDWSPTFDYFRHVKLPFVRRFGLGTAVELERRGFYPAGGGAATVTLFPSDLRPIELPDSTGPPLTGVRVYAAASADLAEPEVGERLAATAADSLGDAGHPICEHVVEYASTRTPGAVVTIRADSTVPDGSATDRSATDGAATDVTSCGPVGGVSAIGERGRSSESVAADALDRFAEFRDAPGAVDRYLADQLVLPLAIGGGEITIPEVTNHVQSNVDLMGVFGLSIALEERTDGGAILRAPGVDV